MKEIGGFFELELNRKREYHPDAIALNSGRNALWYVLKAKKPVKIHLPYYYCHDVLEPIQQEHVPVDFYHINERFEPLLEKTDIGPNEVLLYINYFGLNDRIAEALARMHDYLIIDNSQAFFSKPIEGVDTFYSPRKFLGVPDGGYLYTDVMLDMEFERDVSFDRFEHLVKRLDTGAENSYDRFQKHELSMIGRPIKAMSNLTKSLLSSIDYTMVKAVRERNFMTLHHAFKDVNELDLSIDNLNGPMVYPLLFSKDGLREHLINNKIYVATYWKKVLENVTAGNHEYTLVKYLVPLPIDQRYGPRDMDMIVQTVKDFNKRDQ